MSCWSGCSAFGRVLLVPSKVMSVAVLPASVDSTTARWFASNVS
jgi:hypothetical protein